MEEKPASAEDFFRFPEDAGFLDKSLSAFLTAGLKSGENCLVICIPERRQRLGKSLQSQGLDPAALIADGRILFADAAETLAQIMVAGNPDEALFMRLVGGLAAGAAGAGAAGGGSRLRAFGEMVPLLCEQGNVPAALRLERMWDKLAEAHGVSLFYDGFSRSAGLLRQKTAALEQALEETEEQLRQARKMESVGRLAAGIAHDFNNLLTSINGYSELALGLAKDGGSLTEFLDEIKQSGERAAELTGQLVAYSRKQELAPMIFDLNASLKEMDGMLRRLLGTDIALGSKLDPALHRVKADPGQVQRIILNLALNARDAMPAGGRLNFETANLRMENAAGGARDYSVLSVRDTGNGMDSEFKGRIFEPSFTAQDSGQGKGPGLSSLHGILDRWGGFITVDSQPGQGSVFRIHLPSADK
ncbi:MAG: ATP-binding protein [Fibrobacteria bacterium]